MRRSSGMPATEEADDEFVTSSPAISFSTKFKSFCRTALSNNPFVLPLLDQFPFSPFRIRVSGVILPLVASSFLFLRDLEGGRV